MEIPVSYGILNSLKIDPGFNIKILKDTGTLEGMQKCIILESKSEVCKWTIGIKIFTQSFQHKKFVSDLRQVDGFLWVLRCPPLIKLTTTI